MVVSWGNNEKIPDSMFDLETRAKNLFSKQIDFFDKDTTFNFSIPVKDEKKGTVTYTITPSSYISQGNSIPNSNNKSFTFVIEGFYQWVTKAKNISSFDLSMLNGSSSFMSKTLNEVSLDELKTLVFNNLDNLLEKTPSDLTISNLNISILDKNAYGNQLSKINNTGYVNIKLSLNKYYESGAETI